MARTVTLLEMRDEAKQRADMVNSNFVTDAEWTTYINASAAWLYDLLVSAYGSDYFVSEQDLTTVANTDFYLFSAFDTPVTDFYKMVGVSLVITSDEEIPLRTFMFRNRDRYKSGDTCDG